MVGHQDVKCLNNKCVFRQLFDPKACSIIVLQMSSLPTQHKRQASRAGKQVGPQSGVQGVDALHVRIAIDLLAPILVDGFKEPFLQNRIRAPPGGCRRAAASMNSADAPHRLAPGSD